jgi:hypothetical protein
VTKVISPLSEEIINADRQTEKRYKLFDGGGLYLLVSPDKSKRWRFKYRFEGREKTLSFGIYPETSLEVARSRRDAARMLLHQSIDPSAVRKEEKAHKRAEQLGSERSPSVRVTIAGIIEIWKGGNVMSLTADEARFVAKLLNKMTEVL